MIGCIGMLNSMPLSKCMCVYMVSALVVVVLLIFVACVVLLRPLVLCENVCMAPMLDATWQVVGRDEDMLGDEDMLV